MALRKAKPKAEPEGELIGFDPDEDFIQGGLFGNDENGRIDEAAYVMWDYDKPSDYPNPFLFLRLTIQPCDEEFSPLEADPIQEHISCGGSSGDSGESQFVPNSDGSGVIAVGSAKSLRKGANLHLFLESLKEAGFDGQGWRDISLLNGTICHFLRKAQPKRAGLQRAADEGDGGFEKTYLYVDSIHEEKAAKGKKGAAPAAKSAKAKAKAKAEPEPEPEDAGNEELDNATLEILATILEKDAEVSIKNLRGLVYRKTLKLPKDDREAILETALDEEWLTAQAESDDAFFTFEDGTLAAKTE